MTAHPTRLAFVPARIYDEFWHEWRAISARYPAAEPAPEGVPLSEHWSNLAMLRSAAREELRQATRMAAAKAAQDGHELGTLFPVAV